MLSIFLFLIFLVAMAGFGHTGYVRGWYKLPAVSPVKGGWDGVVIGLILLVVIIVVLLWHVSMAHPLTHFN